MSQQQLPIPLAVVNDVRPSASSPLPESKLVEVPSRDTSESRKRASAQVKPKLRSARGKPRNASASSLPLVSDDGKTDEALGPSPRNKLNDLSAREWLSESVSVWAQRGLGAGHPDAQIERLHPAPFSFTDIARVIKMFTKVGMTVLDPFAGVGSTLKACALEGRVGIGFELYPEFVELTNQRLATELRDLPEPNLPQTIYEGDARILYEKLEQDSIDLIVTSPPYWGILQKIDHKAIQERVNHGLRTHYGEDARDLGNIGSYEEFVGELADTLGSCASKLRRHGHVVVIVGDFRHKSRFYMLHADLANALESKGLVLKAVNILHQRHKRVFPYGYPAAYVPNIHHQYILILRKD
jgi:DNA modification methylase